GGGILDSSTTTGRVDTIAYRAQHCDVGNRFDADSLLHAQVRTPPSSVVLRPEHQLSLKGAHHLRLQNTSLDQRCSKSTKLARNPAASAPAGLFQPTATASAGRSASSARDGKNSGRSRQYSLAGSHL